MARLKNYRILIKAGEEVELPVNASVIRLTAANVPVYFKDDKGYLDFYMVAGEVARLDGTIFDRVRISHLDVADQYVTVTFGDGAGIASATVSGAVSISGNPAVTIFGNSRAAPLFVEDGVSSYGASYRSITALLANTPETVFTPAANVNGAIIHSAQFHDHNTTSLQSPAFLAKASAPVTVIDGDAILSTDGTLIFTSASSMSASLKKPIKIPPGKGLYFITNVAQTGANRSVLYTLL